MGFYSLWFSGYLANEKLLSEAVVSQHKLSLEEWEEKVSPRVQCYKSMVPSTSLAVYNWQAYLLFYRRPILLVIWYLMRGAVEKINESQVRSFGWAIFKKYLVPYCSPSCIDQSTS